METYAEEVSGGHASLSSLHQSHSSSLTTLATSSSLTSDGTMNSFITARSETEDDDASFVDGLTSSEDETDEIISMSSGAAVSMGEHSLSSSVSGEFSPSLSTTTTGITGTSTGSTVALNESTSSVVRSAMPARPLDALQHFLNGSLGDIGQLYPNEQSAKVAGFHNNIELYPHQIVGRIWMARQEEAVHKRGGILADCMGLGKTLQVLARIVDDQTKMEHIAVAGGGRASLIVCPLALISQWASEVRSKTLTLKVKEHYGPSRSKDPADLENADVVVTSYHVVRSEYAAFIKGGVRAALFTVKWRRVVLDEAHEIKRHTSKVAVACFELQAHFRWCLTGTPLQNNVDELHSLFKFLKATPFDDWTTFQAQVTKPAKQGQTLHCLHTILRAFMLRRGKEILSLPARRVEVVYCMPTEAERESYRDLAMAWKRFTGVAAFNFGRAFAAVVKLRQATSIGAALFLRPNAPQAAAARLNIPKFDSAKIRKVMDLLQTIRARPGNEKTIIFSEFILVLDVLQNRLSDCGYKFVRYDGGMTPASRENSVRRIQIDNDVTCLLVSLKAGGVGLNLTACNNVIMVDAWWNPAVEDQAFDRAHRVGQTRDVYIYKLLAVGTVDERVVQLQEAKRRMAQDTLVSCNDGAEYGGIGLTKDQIKAIFE